MRNILILLIVLSVSIPAFAKNEDKEKKQKSLPPGLQRKYERTGELPPGWQKKLMKGQVLNPGLYDRAKQHPIDPGDYSLEPQEGTELLKLEDRIIRIMNDTMVILEVFGIKTYKMM